MVLYVDITRIIWWRHTTLWSKTVWKRYDTLAQVIQSCNIFFYDNKVERLHQSCFLFCHLWISLLRICSKRKPFSAGSALSLHRIRIYSALWRGFLKLEPAPLSKTLVLVPLTPSMGVLIAAILQKMSIEFLTKCAFSQAHTAVTFNEMTVSSHSLCSLAVPLLISLLPYPPISLSFSLSFSHLSVLHLWGQVMNSFPALIGWCMKLLGGMKEHITQRIWNGKVVKGEESAGGETLKCFDKRLWKRERVGSAADACM